MTLVHFQETLKRLYSSPEGRQALESQENLMTFLDTTALSRWERESLLAQPLERLQQYEYMLFANVEETLQAIFPYTCKLLGDAWEDVSTRYFWEHPNPSHRLMTAAEAFPEYLAAQDAMITDYPFLQELALYEWVEAELLSAPNPAYPENKLAMAPQSPQELRSLKPVLNENAVFLQFQYPIPQIIADLEHNPHSDTHSWQQCPMLLWAYRTAKPYHCRFFELNPLLASWLGTLQESLEQGERPTYQASLQPLWQQLQQAQPNLTSERFETEFLAILRQLLEKDILLGSVPA